MAWHLFGTKPLPDSILNCHLDPGAKISEILNKMQQYFFPKKKHLKSVFEMPDICSGLKALIYDVEMY